MHHLIKEIFHSAATPQTVQHAHHTAHHIAKEVGHEVAKKAVEHTIHEVIDPHHHVQSNSASYNTHYTVKTAHECISCGQPAYNVCAKGHYYCTSCKHYTCDGCHKCITHGSRHRCTTCTNFDYCHQCFNDTTVVHRHQFLEYKIDHRVESNSVPYNTCYTVKTAHECISCRQAAYKVCLNGHYYCTSCRHYCCDGCHKCILGILYHCKTCTSFDYCHECFDDTTLVHPHTSWTKQNYHHSWLNSTQLRILLINMCIYNIVIWLYANKLLVIK